CMVRTQYILNLRASPGGEIIDILPFNIKLTALERTDGWLKVDFMGAKGWISADFVEQIGTCG
ncbi:MAG: SH3 domain-containing protein, partial [Chloroflexi bacterium]|nr:SH3 domain-containing protein [Chloroflexota bacterium]